MEARLWQSLVRISLINLKRIRWRLEASNAISLRAKLHKSSVGSLTLFRCQEATSMLWSSPSKVNKQYVKMTLFANSISGNTRRWRSARSVHISVNTPKKPWSGLLARILIRLCNFTWTVNSKNLNPCLPTAPPLSSPCYLLLNPRTSLWTFTQLKVMPLAHLSTQPPSSLNLYVSLRQWARRLVLWWRCTEVVSMLATKVV